MTLDSSRFSARATVGASAAETIPGSRIAVEEGREVLARRSLQEYAPSAHIQVFEAARVLNAYRQHRHPDDLTAAEQSAGKAISAFNAGTGERHAAAWTAAVVYMVELRALYYCADRLTAFDPVPTPPSIFTPLSPLRLEKITHDGHQRILDAARWLDRARREPEPAHVARADQAIGHAARLVHEEFPAGLSPQLWILVCRYSAELHAANLEIRARTDRPGRS